MTQKNTTQEFLTSENGFSGFKEAILNVIKFIVEKDSPAEIFNLDLEKGVSEEKKDDLIKIYAHGLLTVAGMILASQMPNGKTVGSYILNK